MALEGLFSKFKRGAQEVLRAMGAATSSFRSLISRVGPRPPQLCSARGGIPVVDSPYRPDSAATLGTLGYQKTSMLLVHNRRMEGCYADISEHQRQQSRIRDGCGADAPTQHDSARHHKRSPRTELGS